MDKIALLKSRREKLLDSSKEIRKKIAALTDELSFVEQSAFSYSSGEFYDEAQGEGIVCGYATIDGFPFYIIAQNFEDNFGGLCKAGTDKILKCLNDAERTLTPVIFILNSHGIRVGEGLNALEGLSAVLRKSAQLKGIVSQYAIVFGDCFGQAALLAANTDFTFMYEDSALAYSSPFVLSAKSNKNLDKLAVCGADALKQTSIVSFKVKSDKEIKDTILKISNLLPENCPIIADYTELNQTFLNLNTKCTDSDLVKAIFDEKSFVETNAQENSDIRYILGRVGGISCAAIIFTSDNAVRVNATNMQQIKDFAQFAANFDLPFISFVNCAGIEENLETLNSLALKNITDYISVLSDFENPKISVIYKQASGAGYTLFAAKCIGFDYSFAFANANVALFESAQGAEIELDAQDGKKDLAIKRYENEISDPISAAKFGYVDDIIEPSLVKQYLISTLQMLLR